MQPYRYINEKFVFSENLSRREQILCQQLEQIFPNHDLSVIRQTVVTCNDHVTPIENSLQRCIEELVNISPASCQKSTSKNGSSKVLSPVQCDVIKDLKQIFPNYDMKVIKTAVCHPSNLFEPLAKPTLLQRCIEDLLDGRTVLEVDPDADPDHEDIPNDKGKINEMMSDESRININATFTKVEEANDIMITEIEDSQDIIFSDEDDILLTAEESMDLETVLPTPKQSPCVITIGSQDENRNNSNKKTSPSGTPKLKTGLTSATAHISLAEKPDETEVKYLTISPIANITKSKAALESAKKNGSEKQIDKEASDLSASMFSIDSNSSSDTSFDRKMDDMFSSRTIDASDSDFSQSSVDSLDSQQDEDDLPVISRPKTRHDLIMNTPPRTAENIRNTTTAASVDKPKACQSLAGSSVDDNASDLKIKPLKLKLNSGSGQFTKVETTSANKPTASKSNELPLVGSQGSNFKMEPPKVTVSSQSGQFRKPETTNINRPTPGPSNECSVLDSNRLIKPSKFTKNSNSDQMSRNTTTVAPPVSKEKVQGQTETAVVPGQGMATAGNISSLAPTWTPVVAKQIPQSWTPPRPSGSQRTVTIESTHKITYNNHIPDNLIGQNHGLQSEEFGGARPKYSASAPNISVKLPLHPPYIDFLDTSDVPALPRTFNPALDRKNHRSTSATISKAPDDNADQTSQSATKPVLRPSFMLNPVNASATSLPKVVPNDNMDQTPQSSAKPKPVLRPSVLSKHVNASANSLPKTVNNEVRPGPSGIVTRPGDTPVQTGLKIPTRISTFPRFEPDPDPIVIGHDLEDDLEQPGQGVIVIQEEEEQVIQPVAVAVDPSVQIKNDVLNLFPDVDPAYLERLCGQYTGHMAVNNICNQLLENKYPKKAEKSTSSQRKSSIPETTSIDYFKDYHSVDIPDDVVIKYQAQAFQILAQEFLWLSANDIKTVMKKVRHFYAASYQALQTVWHQAVDIAQKNRLDEDLPLVFKGMAFQAKIPAEQIGGIEYRLSVRLLKNRRPVIRTNFNVIEELQREVDFVKQRLKDTEMEIDHKVASALNEQEYESLGQCIECGCCFGEYPFEQMVQCYEGHLFCENCLGQYAKESVFGQGKADLVCMTELCDSSFPKSQLMKALPDEILAKYEDRVTEENLNLADLGDLVKCPHCDFRAFMDPADKVFRCQSDHCQKESCRYCQVEWEEHFGKKCAEVEKKDETKIRLEYEEKMTKAKVRVCHRCKAQFMKSDGCNKMTCRCGGKMCYICRQPNIDYNHFCRHPRDPGKECTSCKACNLWTNPEEDENRAIQEIQKEAEEERKKKGYTESRVIGVPDQPPTKKMKR